jgi:hypothetical protein
MNRGSPEPIIERLLPLLVAIADALRIGMAVSQEIHTEYRWSDQADKHLAYQLIRRAALEELRPQVDVLAEDENFGLPMSGLLLNADTKDVIRVWHSIDGALPRAETVGLRQFYGQSSYRQDSLFADLTSRSDDRSNLAVLWDSHERQFTRFDLVRPAGSTGPIGHVDWRVDLRGVLRQAQDDKTHTDGSSPNPDDDPDWDE